MSKRASGDLTPNEWAMVVARHGQVSLDLTISNPTAARLPYPRDLLSVLSDPEALCYAPDSMGMVSARRVVGERFGVSAEDVVLTASTSEAYSFLFKLLGDPGDTVLVPRPSYPLLDHLASLESLRTIFYALRYDGRWHIDRSSVLDALDSSVRAILVVSPNNPTGNFLADDDREFLLSLGLPLIVDEVFADYPLAESSSRSPWPEDDRGLVFSLGGLSKYAGLPQLKLGWCILRGDPEQRAEARARLEFIADTFLSVNTPVQVGLPSLFTHTDEVRAAIRQRVRMNYAALERESPDDSLARIFHQPVGEISGLVNVYHAEGGWYGILRLPAIHEIDGWMRAFLEEDVLVQPGWLYDLDGPHVVVSLLTPSDAFREGIRRISSRVGRDSR